MEASFDHSDLLLKTSARGISPSGDLVVDIDPALGNTTQPRCEIMRSGDGQFAMLRWHPDVSTKNLDRAQNHRWIVIFEASGDRDPVFARQQIEALRALIKARPQDEFRIIAANTTVRELPIEQLENIHLIAALDLGQAFDEASRLTSWSGHATHVLHLGATWASLGERGPEKLVAKLPKNARYIAASVGRDVNTELIDQLVEKTGGISANIHDGSDLLQLVRRSGQRGVDSIIVSAPGEPQLRFLVDDSQLGQNGGELLAVARLGKNDTAPKNLVVSTHFPGGRWQRELPADWQIGNVGYLPREWARLEIARLVTAGVKKIATRSSPSANAAT